jgi:hypothetical protein
LTRKECLDAAAGCVLKDRQNEYGKPEDCFGMISIMWSAYLGGVCISAHDVAAMMALLKIARFRHNPSHEDNAVDCAGYAACMAECATAWKREGEDEDEGGKQEFKPGDRVQYRVELPSVSDSLWRDATYLRRAFSWQQDGEHIVSSDDLGPVTVKDKDIRPTPKAEGVEELVQKDETYDAPQTKEELMERIKSVNPAIYGAHLE